MTTKAYYQKNRGYWQLPFNPDPMEPIEAPETPATHALGFFEKHREKCERYLNYVSASESLGVGSVPTASEANDADASTSTSIKS